VSEAASATGPRDGRDEAERRREGLRHKTLTDCPSLRLLLQYPALAPESLLRSPAIAKRLSQTAIEKERRATRSPSRPPFPAQRARQLLA
jgi:hypothetical protein